MGLLFRLRRRGVDHSRVGGLEDEWMFEVDCLVSNLRRL
jgi:hypothetical protein